MKKKRNFLLPLLMIVVMMAMSPQRMWAETCTHEFNETTDPNHTVCTKCSHSFFRYTTQNNVVVTFWPYAVGTWKDAKGNDVTPLTNTNTSGEGVIEFDVPIVNIGNNIFFQRTGLISVIVPVSVKTIEENAFQSCSNLTTVVLPGSLTEIKTGAFASCQALSSINIPNSVTSIGGQTFMSCSSLTSINIPTSLASINDCTFQYCSGLTSVTIPGSVQSIGEDAFQDCSNLSSVTIGNSVKSIGMYAFAGCIKLQSITIPSSVKSFGYKPFYRTSIMTVTNESVTPQTINGELINEFWYEQYKSYKTDYKFLTLNVPSAGLAAYREADEWNRFGTIQCIHCNALTKTEAHPATCQATGNKEYWTCACGKVYKDAEANQPTTVNECRIAKDHVTKINAAEPTCTENGHKEYWACDVCNKIFSDEARTNVTTIENLQIPALGHGSKGYTEDYAWTGECYNDDTQDTKVCTFTLKCSKCSTNVVEKPLQDYTKTAHTDAICTATGSTTYSASVTGTYIATNSNYNYNYSATKTHDYVIAALGHSYTSATASDTYKKLDATCTEAAVYYYKCSRCTANEQNANHTFANGSFKGHGNGTGDKAGYTATYTWTNGTAESPKCELSLTCKDCDTPMLTNQTLGSGIGTLTIGTKVDATCLAGSQACSVSGSYTPTLAGSKSYTISDSYQYTIASTGIHDFGSDATRSVCTVCNHGFFRYTAKDNVVVEPRTPFYGKNTNGQNTKSLSVLHNEYKAEEGKCVMELSAPITVIGENAFWNKDILTSIAIPNTVIEIRNSAFIGCSGLTGDLVIPNSVTMIGHNAFKECTSLTGNLTLGNSVQTIGNNAFGNCKFTGDLTIPESVTSIGEYAFENCTGFTGNLTIGNSVQTIGMKAFRKLSNFKGNLTIGNSVQTIGESAFEYCNGFTGDLTIPNSVTSIGNLAFCQCTGLNGNLTVGKSVKSIGNSVFFNCYQLKSVTLHSVPQVLNEKSFTGTSNRTLILDDDSYIYTGSNQYFPSLISAPKYTRTMTDEWGTLVVPFALSAAPEGFEFYTVRSMGSNNELYLRSASTIEAGTPVFVHRTGSGTSLEVTASSNAVNTTIATASGLAMQGTYAAVELNKTDNPNAYFVYNEKLYSTTKLGDANHVTINPFRAYLVTPTTSGAKQLVFVIDGETTNLTPTLSQGEGAQSIYNLNGQKLAAPRKGINIVNGKKVMVK